MQCISSRFNVCNVLVQLATIFNQSFSLKFQLILPWIDYNFAAFFVFISTQGWLWTATPLCCFLFQVRQRVYLCSLMKWSKFILNKCKTIKQSSSYWKWKGGWYGFIKMLFLTKLFRVHLLHFLFLSLVISQRLPREI